MMPTLVQTPDVPLGSSEQATGMDLSVWSKGLPSSTNICPPYFPLQPDALPSEPDTTEPSPASNEKIPEERKTLPYLYCELCDASCSFLHSGCTKPDPSEAPEWVSVVGHCLSPSARNLKQLGHRAKRARVESIIKGMSAGQSRGTETHLEYRHLRLRTDSRACRESLRATGTGHVTSAGPPRTDPSEQVHSKPERIKLMAEVLKYELSRAVSRSVDSVFRSLPPGPVPAPTPSDQNRHARCSSSPSWPSLCRDDRARASVAQAEALSLVVQKAGQRRLGPPAQLGRCDSSLGSGPTWEPRRAAAQNPSRGPDVGLAKPDLFDHRWNLVKVRSKVNSRLARSPFLPRVKMESEEVVRNSSLYVAGEGLTTSHLKKAKLMFFFTRYPSSHTLRTCFHDVQFTRCITSQLIKWFSNFREFYYIQMEKFARHALVDGGVTNVERLAVGRESELFRALSMHYNKAGDFQIPHRFLEVAQITLREFYVAISLGKDREPSWKKAIYKVICKLDADVPAEFKGARCG